MDSPAISQIHTLCLQMERHLSTPFPFSLWAKHCHYSPYHLRHLFTETIGVPPHQYLRRRRLTEAARQLVFSSQPLLEIAFSAGYESQQAFSDAFRRLYHMSPARFRARGFFYPLQLFPEEPFFGPPVQREREPSASPPKQTFLIGWPWPTCPLTDTLAGSKGRTAPPSPPPYQTSVLGFGRGKRCWASQPLPLRGTTWPIGRFIPASAIGVACSACLPCFDKPCFRSEP